VLQRVPPAQSSPCPDLSSSKLDSSEYPQRRVAPAQSFGSKFVTSGDSRGLHAMEGLSLQAKQRKNAPQKTRGCLSQAPAKRGVRASLPAPSRSTATACRRDPRRRRTQHRSCYLRQAPRRRQSHWRVTSNWPPSPCPLHGATRPLPTRPARCGRRRAPSGKYIPQRTRRAAGSPFGVPIRWDRHSLGRPEVLRRSPELSGGRIYRREQKNIQ
jgi:hypothetical protein